MSQRPEGRPEGRRWLRRGLPLAGLALFLAGCAKDAPQVTWQPAGPNAQKIDNLQRPVFYVAGVVLVIVVVAVVYAVFRFRDRGQEIPEQTHGKPALEIGLTILPALILIGIGIPTVATIFSLAPVLHFLGIVISALGAFMMVPALIELAAGHADSRVFLGAAAVTLFSGVSLSLAFAGGELSGDHVMPDEDGVEAFGGKRYHRPVVLWGRRCVGPVPRGGTTPAEGFARCLGLT